MEKNMQKFLGSAESSLSSTDDPDFAAIRDRLIYGEIADRGSLSDTQRGLITLVVLTASQTLDDLKTHVNAALRVGVTPVEIKEAIYQCAPYIGFPKTEAALKKVNEVFNENNIPLPLESQSTVTESSRYADGLSVQKSIFGDVIDTMHKATPAGQLPIVQNYLSAFCFGDIYTRKGLDLKTRELLTFSIISALGGCESQVRSHVQANVAVGNSKQNLVDALAQSLPCIGFPRTLNALACVNSVIPEPDQAK
ncbi:MAG: carboxymuconolactone decarboxylase family protein [Desulfovibrionaceae bacterium]|nr:carboxymuconolactone decarboxylase family protein [Desulfovibrionaceae bacterium]